MILKFIFVTEESQSFVDSLKFCGHSFSGRGPLSPCHLWTQGHPWMNSLHGVGMGALR